MRDWLFWTLLGVFFLVLLSMFSGVLLPFVAGMAVAYLLDPLADKLEDWGLGRTTATIVLIPGFFAVVLLIALLLLPLAFDQAVALVQRVPSYIEQLTHWATGLMERLTSSGYLGTAGEPLIPEEYVQDVRSAMRNLLDGAVGGLQTIGGTLLDGATSVIGVISLLFITPVVAFYLLRDWDNMVAAVDRWLPQRYAPTIRTQLGLMEQALAGFVRGQTMVCICLAAMYSVGLSLAGLNFSILIGLASGALAFIPYVGSWVGLIVSTGVAFAQWGWDPVPVLTVMAIYVAGQTIEGLFLTPKLVGDHTGLHPVWVMFALLAGGSLFGFTGVLLAVPAAAVIAVLVRFLLGRYLDSRYFKGGPPQPIGARAGEGEGPEG